ncbi:ABC transporter permease [Microbacterium hominis]|uniref:Transport permease protein n=1 Tax=Microbacterium hominis TaxID=162426 RepID=A0A7D4PNL1_9MICO|nr:ABC transporter permease [Microbacterium hominis]
MVDARLHAPADGLFEVGRRPPFGAYLAEAWRRRSFALTLAGYRLVGGLLQNRLGVLWIVLKPLLTAIIYGTIFGVVLSSDARPADFAPYIITGVFVFEFFTGCFGGGSRAITGNSRLVQSLGFPRILLPVSVVAEQAMRMIPITVLLGILLLVFGIPISWSWLLVIPILAMMAVFNLGVALIVARMSVWVRDVQQFIPTINRVLFYASSIFFQVDLVFADNPVLLTIAHSIPTYDFIALVRAVMLENHPAPELAVILAPVWTVLAIGFGVVYFWRAEARYGLSE